MFTGLIETTGTLLAVTPSAGATRITIASPTLTSRLNTGDSIAVNGVCLTALSIEPNAFPPRFSADLAAETIAPTTPPHPKPIRHRLASPHPTPRSPHPLCRLSGLYHHRRHQPHRRLYHRQRSR